MLSVLGRWASACGTLRSPALSSDLARQALLAAHTGLFLALQTLDSSRLYAAERAALAAPEQQQRFATALVAALEDLLLAGPPPGAVCCLVPLVVVGSPTGALCCRVLPAWATMPLLRRQAFASHRLRVCVLLCRRRGGSQRLDRRRVERAVQLRASRVQAGHV